MKNIEQWLLRKKNKNSLFNNKPDKSFSTNPTKDYFIIKEKENNFILSIIVTSLKMFVVLILIAMVAGLGIFVGIAKAYIDTTPDLNTTKIEENSETSHIFDMEGNLITEYYGFENRISVSIDEIPLDLQNAFIAIEDARFRAHGGIDYKRFLSSVFGNVFAGSMEGGSTITQQLIKNSILSSEQTYRRKIQEMYLAIQLEQNYTKDEILAFYLNTIQLGSSTYGVKAAAKDYFDKELDELTLTECAILAGIAKSPYRYNPRSNLTPISEGGRGIPSDTFDRTNLVLSRMYENDMITKQEYDAGVLTDYDLVHETLYINPNVTNTDYPMKYFVEYVIYDVRDQLMEKNGWQGDEGRQLAENLMLTGGLNIYTTIDPEIQLQTEQTVYNYDNLPAFANPSNDISSNGVEQPQAAAIVVENSTGHIKAIVGGKQPPEIQRGFNRAFDSNLALGSSIKPLTVYGPFIENDYPGGIIFPNIPVEIPGWESERGYPENYGGGSYTGPVDVREAMRKSLNVVAGRIVLERLSTEVSAQYLYNLNFDEGDITQFPSDLALGTHGNEMIETVAAYETIANEGIYTEPISFVRVTDSNDQLLLSNETPVQKQVFKESTTFILTDWMEDVVHGGTTNLSLDSNPSMPIAGKTGTNQAFKGMFFGGFTPYYTATVWIGHDDFNPSFVAGSTSGSYAAPLWEQIMDPLHAELESVPFYDSVPDGVVEVTVCGVSGLLPNGACELDTQHELVTEYFPEGAVPTEVCNMHQEVTICGYSGKLLSPYCPVEAEQQSAVVVLDEDSPYLLLDEEDLELYFSNAYVSDKPIEELSYHNPEDIGKYCHLHTEEWFNGELARDDATSRANTVIALVDAHIADENYGPFMTVGEKEELNELKNSINAILVHQEVVLPEPDADGNITYIQELVVFDSTEVDALILQLQNLDQQIIDRIDQSTMPTPDPEPEPEPTPEPPPPEE